MNRLLLTGVALIVSWSFAYTPVLAEPAKGPKSTASRSLASRTALCKADCAPEGSHGMLKPYGHYRRPEADPTTVSTESGRKIYAECVRRCLVPLPWFYFQRLSLEVT